MRIDEMTASSVIDMCKEDLGEILVRCLSKPNQITTHVTHYLESMLKGAIIADYSYQVLAEPPLHSYIEIAVDLLFDTGVKAWFRISTEDVKKNDPIKDYNRAMGIVGKR